MLIVLNGEGKEFLYEREIGENLEGIQFFEHWGRKIKKRLLSFTLGGYMNLL